MRPGAYRVESWGSLWFLDDDTNEYLRTPKHEGPRQSPTGHDWGGPAAGPLQDLVWHPMTGWRIEGGRLYVDLPSGLFVSAPVDPSTRDPREARV